MRAVVLGTKKARFLGRYKNEKRTTGWFLWLGGPISRDFEYDAAPGGVIDCTVVDANAIHRNAHTPQPYPAVGAV